MIYCYYNIYTIYIYEISNGVNNICICIYDLWACAKQSRCGAGCDGPVAGGRGGGGGSEETKTFMKVQKRETKIEKRRKN
jgi:hypothetical protein